MERRYNKERAASSEAASNEGIRMARRSGVARFLGRRGGGEGARFTGLASGRQLRIRDAFSKILKRYSASMRETKCFKVLNECFRES